jgi:hypothetical protein
MNDYHYPYLSPRQTRDQAPTAWQQELANALEGIFSRGDYELKEVVEGLNASRVRPPTGGTWTAESFTTVMRELGA